MADSMNCVLNVFVYLPNRWPPHAFGCICIRKLKPNTVSVCIGRFPFRWKIIMSKNKSRHLSTGFKCHFISSLYVFFVSCRYLQHLMLSSNTPLSMGADFTIVLLCNAYSTNPEYFARPMAALFETINKSSVGSNQQPMPTVPLSMVTLDSLTVHSKMSLIHR